MDRTTNIPRDGGTLLTLTTEGGSGEVIAHDPLAHYIIESLRSGMSKEAVRDFLDVRLVTVMSDVTKSESELSELRVVLDKYLACRTLLDRAVTTEAGDFSESSEVTA